MEAASEICGDDIPMICGEDVEDDDDEMQEKRAIELALGMYPLLSLVRLPITHATLF